MALDFPNSPSEGQEHIDSSNGVAYVYLDGKWTVGGATGGSVNDVIAESPLVSDGNPVTPTVSLDESALDLSLCDNGTSGFIDGVTATSPLTSTGTNVDIDESALDLSLCDNGTSGFITSADVNYPVTSVNGETGDVDLTDDFISKTGADTAAGPLVIESDFTGDGNIFLNSIPGSYLNDVVAGVQGVAVNQVYHTDGYLRVRLT